MRIILDVVYLLAMIIVLPYYLFKFVTSAYHRKGLIERFGFIKSVESVATVWLHGASVGEINACEKLIPQLQSQFPGYRLVISTLTTSAQALVKKRYPDIFSFFFPLDLSCICSRVLKRVNPKLVILMEQELWPNFILACDRKNTPSVLLNGRITDHTRARYNLLRWLFKPVLNKIKLLCVQNDDYRRRFEALGVAPERIQNTGNMKYDSLGLADEDKVGSHYRNLFGIKEQELVIIGGSTHSPEEESLLDAYIKLKGEFSNLRLILAPRHPFRFNDVETLIKTKGLESLRHSRLTSDDSLRNPQSAIRILLLDTMGELAKVYAAGDIVFVGGTLVQRGGQSILEPAALGRPIITGPSLYNFAEPAKALQSAGALKIINNPAELYQLLKEVISNQGLRVEMGAQARKTIANQQGATARNIEFVGQILDSKRI
ncbi:MAG: 3-deoxy-D-manno-octulosonic acid transferase [Planctomycetes bacterium]|nr:3-deoxy-D-manno-octulosonic acid transferase [Planctomycetota bacterium]